MPKQPYTVVVTGGAPYLAEYSFNTSAMIRDVIPQTFITDGGNKVRIQKYPISMECTFTSMGKMIEDVWSKKLSVFDANAEPNRYVDFDLVVHMGMRESEGRICFESAARRDHMNFKGLDGEGLPAKYTEDNGLWYGLPEVLYPDLEIAKAADVVASKFPNVPSRLSTNAGGYFCEFQLWTSLALLAKQGKPRTACFVHVPKITDKEAIQNGADATVTFIGTLIDSMKTQKSSL